MTTSPQPTIAGITPMLTVEQVAQLLHCSGWTVCKLCREKKIPGAVRIGKHWFFRRNDVQRHVEGKP